MRWGHQNHGVGGGGGFCTSIFLGDTIMTEFIAIQQCVFFPLFLPYRTKACSDSLQVLLAVLWPSHQITFSFRSWKRNRE